MVRERKGLYNSVERKKKGNTWDERQRHVKKRGGKRKTCS